MKRRITAFAVVFTLILTSFTACGGKAKDAANHPGNEQTGVNDDGKEEAKKDEDANAEEGTGNEEAEESGLPPMTTEKITLSYACWGLGEKGETEAKDKQIAAFMEAYPNITVEFVTIDQPTWDEGLTTLAATGSLPDVFGVFSVTNAIMNQWALDVTEFAEMDPDVKEIYPSMLDISRIDGKLYSMPWVMFPQLVFVNKTLFEKYNEPLPSYDWTIDEFIDIATRISHPEDFNFGTSNPIYNDYFPAMYSDTQSMRGWDGKNYAFDQTWIDAMNLRYDFIDNGVCEWATPEQKLQWLGDEAAWPPGYGRSAMHWDWSWTIAVFEDAVKAQSGCEFLYYPQPKGPSGKQMAIVDYSIISATTEHPREAWELQKWVTWGREACLNRMEGYQEAGVPVVSRMPVINNEEVWKAVSDYTDRKDIIETYKRLVDIVPNPGSVAPGWNEFNIWTDENTIWGKLDNREITPAEIADTLTEKANEFKEQWIANLPQ